MDIKQIINEEVSQFLGENGVKNKRPVLFTDENGNNIVYEDDSYRISVDDPEYATYVVLWHKEIVNGKEYWAKRGYLESHISERRFDDDFEKYLSIGTVAIEGDHRNKGYGKKMYQALIDFSGNDVVGLYSHTPNRVNKTQVPTIYNRLGAEDKDDYQIIKF